MGVTSGLAASTTLLAILEVPAVKATAVGLGLAGGGLAGLVLSVFLASAAAVFTLGLLGATGGMVAAVGFATGAFVAVLPAGAPVATPAGFPAAALVEASGTVCSAPTR